eukprot:snap_masked-scaffold647_size119995-processed-gene-0.10 protein:Tk06265 transcript:snap_masked-scaffold647_size119995-processed-gene-0.10-mRNA-1 annotation:"atp synthase"
MGLERRRGYIRATEEQDNALERWSIPSYGGAAAAPKDTALNYDPSWEPPEPADEDQEPEIELTMLTADALEGIRQSAVEEGMEEGRVAGFDEGREAGFEEGKTAGFEEGKEEGHQQGLTEGQQLIEERCQHLDAMIEKLAFPLVQIDHQVQQQVIEMVLYLAKAVIHTEVVTNPQMILNTLREAAQREIALSVGEPPATKGYPPSVFAKLPALVERAGNGDEGQGSITAFFTVLTEGDDLQDPIADAARAILDGHIVLSREMADAGHYPAIDVERSVSRVMPNIVNDEHMLMARAVRQILSVCRKNQDLVSIGAYKPGTDQGIDQAFTLKPRLDGYLQQGMKDVVPYDMCVNMLRSSLQ